ncbi:MAG: hypothetical protein OSA97_14860, partial [Nevskia sp.]|nr:hypothetical protein [Nevskia sp.]
AFLLKATVGGRRGKPDCDVALRVEVESFSPSAEVSGIRFFPNMRVPMTSPIFDTYRAGYGVMGYEELSEWTTSRGDGLPSRRAFTSGLHLRTFVYGLVSLI